jgi:cytochrome P450
MVKIAGETTNTAISATFFYLSRHHDVYQKLVHEIRTSFASAEQINGSGLTACTYLRACIDESLRLSPPAPSILWRELVPGEESSKTPFVVDGHVIPKGTIVGVSTYSLHHNDAYFPDPFSFNPERWLDTSTFSSETKKLMREAFVPFSIGSRACAGKAMAYLETGLMLAMTIWYFDFKVARGSLGKVGGGQAGFEKRRRNPGEFQLYDVFGASHDGPYLTFKPRGDFWKEL